MLVIKCVCVYKVILMIILKSIIVDVPSENALKCVFTQKIEYALTEEYFQ